MLRRIVRSRLGLTIIALICASLFAGPFVADYFRNPKIILVRERPPPTRIGPDQEQELREYSEELELPREHEPGNGLSLLTSTAGLLGTISTLILAWRADRKATSEEALKLIQLQQQITELQNRLRAAAMQS